MLVADPVLPEIFQFTDRTLDQTPVSDRQLSWDAHLSEPGLLRRVQIAGIPVLHPSDHDPMSVRSNHCLGRIEVDAIVNGLIKFFVEGIRCFIVAADDADGSVSVVVFKSLGQHVLGTYQENLFPVQFKEVRAFPHFAEASVILEQDLFKFPFQPVRTAEQQDLSVFVRRTVPGYAAESPVGRPPDPGIAEIEPASVFRQVLSVKYRGARVFLIVDTVPDCNTLCPEPEPREDISSAAGRCLRRVPSASAPSGSYMDDTGRTDDILRYI